MALALIPVAAVLVAPLLLAYFRRRREMPREPLSRRTSPPKKPEGLWVVHGNEEAAVDLVFIPDDISYDQPPDIRLAGVRLVTFAYDVGEVSVLDNVLNRPKLEACARRLLDIYPLYIPWDSSSNPIQRDVDTSSKSSLNLPDSGEDAMQELRDRVAIERPAIFVAHGLGGLIYEQAVALSYGHVYEPDKMTKRRWHAALLLDTPHHQAGLAEWATMCAKHRGIQCKDTAQEESWSSLKINRDLLDIHNVQIKFRAAIRAKVKVDIAACYAAKRAPYMKQMLSPNWAVLPDFTPIIAADLDHFSLMEWQKDPQASKKIQALLAKWVVELPGKSVKDRTPPSPPDPLKELRNILGYEEPKNPWVSVPVETREDVTGNPYALGNIISRSQWGRHTRLVKLAKDVPPSSRPPLNTATTATRKQLVRAGFSADDVDLWIGFAESLSGIGIELQRMSDTEGLPGVPDFSEITTETWSEYEDYGKIAQLTITKSDAEDSSSQFFFVVGTKTVHGAVAQDDTTFLRDQQSTSDNGPVTGDRRVPEDMVIAYRLEEIMTYFW